MSEQNIIEIKQLTKKYGRKIALSSLSFAFKKGEAIALIGPSGAGKTTLLNVLAAILQPDEGEIFIEGKPLHYYNDQKSAKKNRDHSPTI